MVDSSVDVCDLMIRLLCAECSDRACAESESETWSHSKLMDCIRKPIAEVDIHLRRIAPRGVNDCDSFTTEGKGDLPDGYPMSCANCSHVGDKENCPYEPRIHIDTYKIGDELDAEWKVTNIITHKEEKP